MYIQHTSSQELALRQPHSSPSNRSALLHSRTSLSFIILLTTCWLFCSQAWSSQIHEHGYWISSTGEGHVFDSKLANALGNFLLQEKAQQCVDFGAGKGDYVRSLRAKGIYCDGYDGNPFSPELSKGAVLVADLSQPLALPFKYDWVISLEVGALTVSSVVNHTCSYLVSMTKILSIGKAPDFFLSLTSNAPSLGVSRNVGSLSKDARRPASVRRIISTSSKTFFQSV